jgi:VWFA-related protein
MRNHRLPGTIQISMRFLLSSLAITGILLAQDPVKPEPARNDEPVLRETFKFVMAPVTVTDRDGNFINGLTAADFRLFDNKKLQRVTEDVTAHPISLAVVVQASANVEKILPQIQKLGSLLQAQVLGEEGELALMQFDHRITTVSDFTSDPDKISAAFKKLKAGSAQARLNDATIEAVHLLKNRPASRRRALLLISESRDNGSELRAREVLTEAEFANVVIYSVNISRLMSSLTATPPPPRPNLRPPGAEHLPAGVVSTPTTESQNAMGNWVPLLNEIFVAAKAIFVSNPLEVYTRYTGGREQSFMNQKDLDRAVSNMGEELHSQYLITYSPNNQDEAGFHNIVVEVKRPGLIVRTRDGYYLAGTAPEKDKGK